MLDAWLGHMVSHVKTQVGVNVDNTCAEATPNPIEGDKWMFVMKVAPFLCGLYQPEQKYTNNIGILKYPDPFLILSSSIIDDEIDVLAGSITGTVQ